MKALACELPATHGLPLGRFSRTELHRLVIERGLSDASAWQHLPDRRRRMRDNAGQSHRPIARAKPRRHDQLLGFG